MEKSPEHQVTLTAATSLVVADMVGVGVFTSLGFQVTDLSSLPVVLALWLAGGVLALCGAVCYAELASMFPRSSGEYNLLSKICSPGLGFVAGWLSATVGFTAPVALAAIAFGQYAQFFLSDLPPLWLAMAAIWFVGLVHLSGLKIGAIFHVSATAVKLGLILLFIVAGLATGLQAPAIDLTTAPDWSQVLSRPFASGLVFVMYSYSGWNAAIYVSDEIKDQSRTLPRALVAGTIVVITLYVLLNAVFLLTTPISAMAGQVNVAQIAGRSIFGQNGGWLVDGLIAIGLVSTISAMVWTGPRVVMVMGQDLTPLAAFAKRSSGQIPWLATIAQLLVSSAMLLAGGFEAILDFVQFSLIGCSFLAVSGLVWLRIRRPDLPRPYSAWGYPVTSVLFLIGTGYILYYLLVARTQESFVGICWAFVGYVVYRLMLRFSSHSQAS